MTSISIAAEQLGPDGPGFYLVERLIPTQLLTEVNQDLELPLDWFAQYNSFVNDRNVVVDQAFEVFAHKCSRGPQEFIDRLAGISKLGDLVTTELVEPLQMYFPSLTGWQIDEMVAQHYQDNIGELTWHMDLARHPCLIVICNVVGQATLKLRQLGSKSSETKVELAPTDVLMLRATDLFDSQAELRPEHAVSQTSGEFGRTSVTFRANSQPDKQIRGFYYHNWGPKPPINDLIDS